MRFLKNQKLTHQIFALISILLIFQLCFSTILYKKSTNSICQEIILNSENEIFNTLSPAVENLLKDEKALFIYLNEIVGEHIYYVGVLDGSNYLAFATTPDGFFKRDPHFFAKTLPKYPNIKIEVVMNAKNFFLLSYKTLLFWMIFINLLFFVMAILGIKYILKPIKEVQNRLSLYTKNAFLENKTDKNEIALVEKYFDSIILMHSKQQESLRKVNLHLEDLVESKTSYLRVEVQEKTDAKLRLENSNEEKTLLLKELHHRVKNNLAIIVGLIRMQSRRVDEDRIKSMFLSLQNRIKAMELVHSSLYATKELNHIDMKEYLYALVKHLSDSFAMDEKKIDFSISCEGMILETDRAIACGQIVNELVTNAYKHAFKNTHHGAISVAMRDNGNFYELRVKDDGKNNSFKDKNSSSLGMYLVNELVKHQLKGVIELKMEEGLEYIIRFDTIRV